MIGPQGPGGKNTAVDVAHYHRQTAAGSHMQNFVHIQQAVGRSGCKNPGAGSSSGHGGGHSAVFAFHRNEAGVQFAIFNHGGHRFHNAGLGSDGVAGYYVHPGAFYGQRGSMGAGIHYNLRCFHTATPPPLTC